jgi:hypothetical protein
MSEVALMWFVNGDGDDQTKFRSKERALNCPHDIPEGLCLNCQEAKEEAARLRDFELAVLWEAIRQQDQHVQDAIVADYRAGMKAKGATA